MSEQGLETREYRVRVLVQPSILDERVLGAKAHYETRTITGYTLKDAKRRAGIQ